MKTFAFKVEEGVYEVIEATSLEEARKKFGKKVAQEEITPPTIPTAKPVKGIYDNILRLKEENFFSEPRTIGEIKDKLTEVAVHYPITSFPPYLHQLVNKRILRRYKQKKDDKEMWVYVNP